MDHRWLAELRARIAGRQLDLDALLQGVVDAATERFEADRGTLYLVDKVRGELVSRVAHLPEIREIRLALGEGVAGWVAEQGVALRIPAPDDARFTPRIDAATGYTTHSLLAVPVHDAAGAVVGVLQVLNKRGGPFTEEDARQLSALAAELAQLLDQSSLGAQLGDAQRHPLAWRFNQVVGESIPMREALDRTARAAATDATVLVRGESGTGKELIARAVHHNSARREAPFVVVDLAALPKGLLENELFGHVQGAFTGADRDRPGKVAAAEGGTLFLDEVGELPLEVQSKLLRLLQERSWTPVGGTRSSVADLRFVCATHRDLEAMVRAGTFRQDLYYRLRVVEIRVPPLRERGHGDLDRLIDFFLHQLGREHGRPGIRLGDPARARLHGHDWPGNVRELRHCLESAVVLAQGGLLLPADLPLGTSMEARVGSVDTDDFSSGIRSLADLERAYIRHVLDRCGGNKSEAARLLGIGRNTLLRKLGG